MLILYQFSVSQVRALSEIVLTMSYVICGQEMGRYSQFFRVLAFLGALLIVVDMVSDGLAVSTYKQGCDEDTLPCYFWISGAFFMVLPTLVLTVAIAVWQYCHDLQWPWKIATILVFGLCYPFTTPAIAIFTKGKALLCGDTLNESVDKKAVSAYKLVEVVFEALPQVSYTVYYI